MGSRIFSNPCQLTSTLPSPELGVATANVNVCRSKPNSEAINVLTPCFSEQKTA